MEYKRPSFEPDYIKEGIGGINIIIPILFILSIILMFLI